MGLPKTDQSWEDEIAEAAATEFKATISILDPNSLVTTPYDPVTGTGGGSTPLVIGTGIAARAQHIRTPTWQQTTYDASAYRHYRFQIAMEGAPAEILKGWLVRVDANPRDLALVGETFTVQASTNSSNAAVRTIETLGAAT